MIINYKRDWPIEDPFAEFRRTRSENHIVNNLFCFKSITIIEIFSPCVGVCYLDKSIIDQLRKF